MRIKRPCDCLFSLEGRLTAHYTIVTFLILVMGSALMYWRLVDSFNRGNDNFLDSHAQEVGELVRKGDNAALAREVLYEDPAASCIHHYERVLDGGGHVVLETPSMGTRIPTGLFNAICKTGRKAREIVGGRSYVLKSALIDLKAGGKRCLQVALDVSQEEKIRNAYRDQLLVVLLLWVVLSACAGIYIARRNLSPLKKVAETARGITVSNLDTRICNESLPKELQDLARAFEGMLDRLKQSFEGLSNYSANLAHELRTPIAILMGEAEVSLARPRSAEEYRQVIESELEECRHLTRLIGSLQFLAQIDRDEIELNPEEVDVRELVHDAWEFYAPLVEERGITLVYEGDERFRCDRGLLRRVLGNLLHNAIVYNRKGGKVTVAMRRRDDGFTEISIGDTGCGIAPELIPHIFDRFYRTGRSRLMSPMWPGLVLPIAKAIMDLHDGTITVDSELDQGTTFTLRFPPPVA